ncbi:MAG TPA: SEC-C metal-binding domain-containing protein [Vicinamibacterales bacterium]|nr:SEC-C metal-binding domain-containing protein [Vicinamibacterales bacterium]
MRHTTTGGRNDLCACGSGKKFKKCHGLKPPTNRGNTFMLILVGLLVVAGAAAVVTSFTSERSDVGRPGGVWSPEHGHYH